MSGLRFRAAEDVLRRLQLDVDQSKRNTPSGARLDYAPNHTMTLTAHAPVGSASGWYVRMGDLLVWEFSSNVGAGVGTGTMQLAPPVDIEPVDIYGMWRLTQGANMAFGPVTLAQGGALLEFIYPATWPAGTLTSVTHATPFTLNTGDSIGGFVVARASTPRVAP